MKVYTASERRIYDSMEALLARAGLEYSGGFVDAGSHRVHYLDYGAGPAVLLVHGGGAGSAMWFRQIAALAQNYRVLAPDNPLFGLSSRPDRALSVPEVMSGFLESFMDSLHIESASIAALSMGGFAAARFAGENPHRTDRLVLLDSAGLGSDLPWGFRLSSLPGLKHLLTRPQRWIHERFFAMEEVVNSDGEDNDAYLEYAYNVTRHDGHANALRQALPVFTGLRGQRHILTDDELTSIKAPTLLIWGERDRFFPLSHARRASALIPGSRLEIIPECGHVSPLDQPETVTRLISQFLGEA